MCHLSAYASMSWAGQRGPDRGLRWRTGNSPACISSSKCTANSVEPGLIRWPGSAPTDVEI